MKQSGLGDNFYVGGYDLSGDTASLDECGGGPAVIDVTGINKYAYERIGGLRDGRMEWTSHFNHNGDDNDGTHNILATLPYTDRHAMYCRGTTLGAPAACLVGKQLNYDPTRGDDGKLTIKVHIDGNQYGLEWGRTLTAGIRSDTDETDGDSIDTDASADFGGQAYLQVFSFTGTDATITIQDSADDSTFADVTDFSFTEITAAPFVERIALANTDTLRQYLRVVTTTTGGFSELSFAVTVIKNETAGIVF